MNKNLVKFTLLILIYGGITESCRPERPCDSYGTNAGLEFINIQTGSNLLFGPGRIYNATSIRVYSIQGSDTVYHEGAPRITPFSTTDSVFAVVFDEKRFDTAYIELSRTDVDTMALVYELHRSTNCPDSYTVQSLNYNGVDLQPGNKLTYIIGK